MSVNKTWTYWTKYKTSTSKYVIVGELFDNKCQEMNT